MTPQEHYREAEKLLQGVSLMRRLGTTGSPGRAESGKATEATEAMDTVAASEPLKAQPLKAQALTALVAMAQVHATLATVPHADYLRRG